MLRPFPLAAFAILRAGFIVSAILRKPATGHGGAEPSGETGLGQLSAAGFPIFNAR
jgi:hypothetical protein